MASPNDNFLLFGANCKEDNQDAQLFTKQLVEVIELHCAIKTSFTVELPPSDMKFTIFLNGVLNNVATHFSSFANECHADCTVL